MILNLYAGIGGNRHLWPDGGIVAVERDPKIAAEYARRFPADEVVVGDAHEYLKENDARFDFIWASPPCPTHSRFWYRSRLKGVESGSPSPMVQVRVRPAWRTATHRDS